MTRVSEVCSFVRTRGQVGVEASGQDESGIEKTRKAGAFRVRRNDLSGLVAGTAVGDFIFETVAVFDLVPQEVTRAGSGFDLTMAEDGVAERSPTIGIVQIFVLGIPSPGHSPCDRFFKGIEQCGGGTVIDRSMIIAESGETHAVVVATVMRTLWAFAIDRGTFSAGEEVAVFVGQEVIADIAPAIHIHVVILDAAHFAARFDFAAGVVIAAGGGVMDHGAGEFGHLGNATLRGAGVPAVAIAKCRPVGAAGLSGGVTGHEPGNGSHEHYGQSDHQAFLFHRYRMFQFFLRAGWTYTFVDREDRARIRKMNNSPTALRLYPQLGVLENNP
jgi:hypothetical protein